MDDVLNTAREAADSIDTNEIETEVVRIDTVDDQEYDERVVAYVEITHPELERLGVKYVVGRGFIEDETDKVHQYVEYHVNPHNYDTSSLLTETTTKLNAGDYMRDAENDELIDAVRTAINAYDHQQAVNDILSDTEKAYWILSCTDGRDPHAIVDSQ